MTPGIPQDGDEEVVEDDEEEVRRMERERETEEITSSLTSERQKHLEDIKEATVACQTKMGVLDQEEIATDDDDGENPDEWEVQTGKKGRGRSTNKIVYKRRLYAPMSEAERLGVGDVWALSLRDRWRLYNCWASLFCQEKAVLMRNLSEQYSRCAARLSELNAEQDYQVQWVTLSFR